MAIVISFGWLEDPLPVAGLVGPVGWPHGWLAPSATGLAFAAPKPVQTWSSSPE